MKNTIPATFNHDVGTLAGTPALVLLPHPIEPELLPPGPPPLNFDNSLLMNDGGWLAWCMQAWHPFLLFTSKGWSAVNPGGSPRFALSVGLSCCVWFCTRGSSCAHSGGTSECREWLWCRCGTPSHERGFSGAHTSGRTHISAVCGRRRRRRRQQQRWHQLVESKGGVPLQM
jgi:hypothetical protein